MNEPPHPPLDARRKRLLFRCRHCGMHENDVLLGGFAERHLAALSDEQVARLEALLEENDIDVFKWITGKAPAPPPHDHDLLRMLRAYAADT